MRLFLFFVLMLLLPFSVTAFELENPECIAPAKPKGGHDIMCRLLVASLADALLLDTSVHFMPGGIGALAYNHAINVVGKKANTVVAASTGTVLNLALGKFGRYKVTDVRWLGAVAADYGVIAVRRDAPWQTLSELLEALKMTNGEGMIFGASGSIGSQDWLKMALILDQGRIDPRSIRYISFEGGGEAVHALLKGHIQIFPGDITEVVEHLDSGAVKVLAVFADKRLPGKYASIPTAVEQGWQVVWPVWRGYYLPPGISHDEYRWWINTLYRLEGTGVFARERTKLNLFPMFMVGEEFDRYVKEDVQKLREIADRFGLEQ